MEEITELERQSIEEALSDWMADESFEQLTERILYRLSELRKPSEWKPLAANEIEAVEKEANRIYDSEPIINCPRRRYIESAIQGAEFLAKLRADEKPSESKLDIAQLEKQLDEALNSETKESLTEWLLKQRKPSEDLVDAIEALFWENSNSYLDDCIIRSCDFKDVATEIANLAPFQVNAELLEALKSINKNIQRSMNSGILKYPIELMGQLYSLSLNAIQNAETCKP